MPSMEQVVTTRLWGGSLYAFVSPTSAQTIMEFGGYSGALSRDEYQSLLSEVTSDSWLVADLYRLANPQSLLEPSSINEALSVIKGALEDRRILAYLVESEIHQNADQPGQSTSTSGQEGGDNSADADTPRTASQGPSGNAQSIPVAKSADSQGLEPRIYGGVELPCGGYDCTKSNVYLDPATANKAGESWRRPNVQGTKVIPYAGTKTPPKPSTINNAKYKGETITKCDDDGAAMVVARDANGFPEFTTFDTYIDDEHIGSGKSAEHFKAANENLIAAMEREPGLQNKLGLSDNQVTSIKAEPTKAPPGFVWHHHQDVGRMQLVNKAAHDEHRHTGGMAIWGGGHK